MKAEKKDFFAQKAGEYDGLKSRTQNVEDIGKMILAEVSFSKDMHVMDFGSGTGLLLSQIAPFVQQITAIDVSPAMNEVLRSKIDAIDGEVELLAMDLTKETLNIKFDAIVSSMTIHHIQDPADLFKTFYSLVKEQGTISIADLALEDGSFHSEDTGVFHFGFEPEVLMRLASDAGFRDLKIQIASVIEKSTGEYPVLLLTGRR